MYSPTMSLQSLCIALLLLIAVVNGITFDLMALPEGGITNERCFSMYMAKDVLVTGSFTSTPGQYQSLNVEFTDAAGSVLYSKKDAIGSQEYKFSFTTHEYADYMLCFINNLASGIAPQPSYFRTITFTTKTGLEAEQYTHPSDTINKLKPLEAELKYLQDAMQTIVNEMEYLKGREALMRDTNESTNNRVKWFSVVNTLILVSSGIWQLWYLRNFFQTKKLM
ncbi:hypothetical protein MP228_009311 [Amoeboaphelidium protococcarum]|nr:hypothetical protein MP228_009311 [Amoeboaphelidium protococcarum]